MRNIDFSGALMILLSLWLDDLVYLPCALKSFDIVQIILIQVHDIIFSSNHFKLFQPLVVVYL